MDYCGKRGVCIHLVQVTIPAMSLAVKDWLATNIMSCDPSVRATMFVDTGGKILAHKRRPDLVDDETIDETPLVVRFPSLGLATLVKLDRASAKNRVYSKVIGLFTFSTAGIEP